MTKRVVSFGFKHGVPQNSRAIIVDVRPLLRNPWSVAEFRGLSGMDPRVMAWLSTDPQLTDTMQILYRAVEKGYETIYIGCNGGKHRSVYLAERLADDLPGLQIGVEHRDLHQHQKKGA